ncbi:MAG TPA: flavin-dependent oxidoreductase [Methylomirabilota bacterium]|jgi:5-methylphenazine-1-carboxylate 1-monooxygenase|nr:flavin-dependent oxidoreductase [Methylomirabilota bacterium]
MDIAIVGGGIGGLTLALALHQRGLACRVYESAPEVRELGVGITLLPHAMRVLTALGLGESLASQGIENRESCFFNRFGQLIYSEPRGRIAGYPVPEVGIHRGRVHLTLWRAAVERLGAERLVSDHHCVGLEQSGGRVTLRFRSTQTGAAREPITADVVVACDGVNSAVRRQFYPDDPLCFGGINTWRGVTRAKPFLTGRSYVRVGSIQRGNLVIYPIADDVDGDGRQLINWTSQVAQPGYERNDWNKPGRLEDFLPIYAGWTFDWLDIPDLLRRSDVIFEYPMVDRDPIDRWTFGRVTLLGDAAHPMYPRGSNGAAQAILDARALADRLAAGGDPAAALAAYEAARSGPTARVVRTNREQPPDYLIRRVEELVGDAPFDDLDRYISRAELRGFSEEYKRVTGFTRDDVTEPERPA